MSEDFTTYTEVDPSGNITVVDATECNIKNIDLGRSAYLYIDKGAGALTGNTVTLKLTADTYTSNGRAFFWGFSYDIGDFGTDTGSQSGPFIGARLRHNNNPGNWQFTIHERDSGDVVSTPYEHTNQSAGEEFWITIDWSGDSFTMEIYSDASRTTLLDTLSITLKSSSNAYQYNYALGSDDRNLVGSRDIDFTVEDMVITGGATDDSEDLFAKFTIATPSGSADLAAEFTVRHSATQDLKAVFEIQGSADLFADFTVNRNRIRILGPNSVQMYYVDLDESVYLYQDYGAGNLNPTNNPLITFDVLLEDYISDGKAYGWGFSDYIGEGYGDPGPSIDVYFRHSTAPDVWEVVLREVDSGGTEYTSVYQHTDSDLDTQLWITVTWKGSSLVCYIYDDAAKTNLVGMESLTLQSAAYSFRYGYALRSSNESLSGRAITYTINDLALNSSDSKDLFAKFTVGEPFADLKAEFTVRHTETRDLFAVFETQAVTFYDLFSEFIVRNAGTADLFAEFTPIRSASADLAAEFTVSKSATADLFSEFIVRLSGTADVFAKFLAVNSDYQELYAKFEIQATASLFAEFIVRHTATEELHGFFHVGQDSKDLLAEFIVQHADSEDLFVQFMMRQIADADLHNFFHVGQDSADLRNKMLISAIGYGNKGGTRF